MLLHPPCFASCAVQADPPWCRSLAWLGERHTEQLNRDVDEEALALIKELDASRPTMAARPRKVISFARASGALRRPSQRPPVRVAHILYRSPPRPYARVPPVF